MGTNYDDLTWLEEASGRRRWRKKYRGATHYFPVKAGESKADSYRRCLGDWQILKTKLDVEPIQPKPKPMPKGYKFAIETREQMLDWWRSHPPEQGDSDPEVRRTKELVDRLKVQAAMPEPPELSRGESQPFEKVSQAGMMIWEDRFRMMEQEKKQVAQANSVDAVAKLMLAQKRGKATAQQVSVSRYDTLRVHLDHFVSWHGGTKAITTLDARCLMEFHTHLITAAAAKNISYWTAWSRMQSVKQFVRFAWALSLIELPRNITSKDLTIVVPAKKIKAMSVEDFKKAVIRADSKHHHQTALYFLLMANCGFTGVDIATLKHDMVNWKQGRITRKRAKTEAHEGAPEVSWKLWPETLKRLKDAKSNHDELVLLNEDGGPLRTERIKDDDGKLAKSDCVRLGCKRVLDSLGLDASPKQIRKMSATLLESNHEFARYSGHFLGHAPRGIKDKFYAAPSIEEFDKAVAWLGQQLGY